MPNHIHATLCIDMDRLPEVDVACNVPTISPRAGSLSTIIRSFKASCTKRAHELGWASALWQSRFHDHIIRDRDDLERIREYIRTNQEYWEEDALREI